MHTKTVVMWKRIFRKVFKNGHGSGTSKLRNIILHPIVNLTVKIFKSRLSEYSSLKIKFWPFRELRSGNKNDGSIEWKQKLLLSTKSTKILCNCVANDSGMLIVAAVILIFLVQLFYLPICDIGLQIYLL